MSAKKYQGLEGQLYDLFRGGDDLDEIGFYIEKISELGGSCLDVGCGTGRVLIPLAHSGIDITGIDSSSEMIANCLKNLGEENIATDILEGNMVNFDLGKKFNSLIVPGGSFQLIHDYEDAVLTLKNFHSHLNPGGTLILSLFNPFYEISHEHLDGVWRLEKDEVNEETNERALCHTCIDLDRCEQIMRVTNRYELLDGSGVVKRSEVKTSHIRWYGKYEIELLLEKSGFSNVTTHGDFQDLEYEDGSVALAVKATV